MHLARRLLATNPSLPPGGEAPRPRWTLVIAGPNVHIPSKLLAAQAAQRLLVIQAEVPREQDRLTAGTLDLVADTVLRRDVGAIVVFGQSSDVATWPRVTLGAQHQGPNAFSSMVQRMADRMERVRRAQNRVRVQLKQIHLDTRIAAASISRGIILCGLFHITESNAFLLYDHTQCVTHLNDSHLLG